MWVVWVVWACCSPRARLLIWPCALAQLVTVRTLPKIESRSVSSYCYKYAKFHQTAYALNPLYVASLVLFATTFKTISESFCRMSSATHVFSQFFQNNAPSHRGPPEGVGRSGTVTDYASAHGLCMIVAWLSGRRHQFCTS